MKNPIDDLKAAYAAEQANPSVPLLATDIPLSYEAITDDWLTAIICRDVRGARVLSHSLSDPDEGNTSRRRIFLEYNESGAAAGLPRTVFCKASHHLASRIATGICGGIYCEVTFYNHVRPMLEIEAPRSIWANYNPKTMNSIVMLHDLSDHVQFCTLTVNMTDERLRGQMELLAQVHGRFYAREDRIKRIAMLPAWPEYFSRLSVIGLQDICASGFRAAQSVIPARLYARKAEIWPATLASVARHHDLPRMLIHSDVHLRNWYISGQSEMGLNDWQGACIGHWGRDVAYASTAAMTVEKRRKYLPDLIAYYLDRFRHAGGPAVSMDEAIKHYRQQLFGALAWWTVTMPAPDLPLMQPIDVTLEMIKRLTHAIDDFDALDSFE